MERKAKTQYWMEFAVDAISLFFAFTITALIIQAFTAKIPETNLKKWFEVYAILALSFLLSSFFFHTGIDLHERNRLSEMISTFKNHAVTYLLFIVMIVFTRNYFREQRTLILVSFCMCYAFAILGRYFLKRWLTNSYKGNNKKIASYVGVLTTKDRAEDFVRFL